MPIKFNPSELSRLEGWERECLRHNLPEKVKQAFRRIRADVQPSSGLSPEEVSNTTFGLAEKAVKEHHRPRPRTRKQSDEKRRLLLEADKLDRAGKPALAQDYRHAARIIDGLGPNPSPEGASEVIKIIQEYDRYAQASDQTTENPTARLAGETDDDYARHLEVERSKVAQPFSRRTSSLATYSLRKLTGLVESVTGSPHYDELAIILGGLGWKVSAARLRKARSR